MFPRILAGIRNSVNNTTSIQRPRMIEDSSEELVRVTKSSPLPIASITAVFGLSNNKADDFIQKDLISSSWS
jgi:hypothetical protein